MKSLAFGHPPPTIRFWKRLAREALRVSGSTPLYVFSAQPVAERIAELDKAFADAGFGSALPSVRQWLSCKTQPIPPLLRWWRERGGDIEVVSEFELRAALTEGFPASRILVNGPAKHRWLPQMPLRGLSVNFDSAAELAALLPLAKKLNWRKGLRICTRQEFDPENQKLPTQFGFTPTEALAAIKRMRTSGVEPEMIHFHLRTNVATPKIYADAIAGVARLCRAARLSVRFLDIGGGLPPRHALSRMGEAFDTAWKGSSPTSLATMLKNAAGQFPALEEIWLENGRFVSACSGVLVVRVSDVKERRGVRQLICDGGRTMNALVSNWERHEILPLEARRGPMALTAAFGPTCMAFDQLALRPLPRSLRAGDHLIWMEAGAYHIPWETRFSHGHAAVAWHDERGLRLARERQDFEGWWGIWA